MGAKKKNHEVNKKNYFFYFFEKSKTKIPKLITYGEKKIIMPDRNGRTTTVL